MCIVKYCNYKIEFISFFFLLQDGTFSVSDFSEAFQEHEVQRVLRAYPDTITMDIHCEAAGLWSSLPDKNFAKTCRIRINPVDVINSGSDKINGFIGEHFIYLKKKIKHKTQKNSFQCK